MQPMMQPMHIHLSQNMTLTISCISCVNNMGHDSGAGRICSHLHGVSNHRRQDRACNNSDHMRIAHCCHFVVPICSNCLSADADSLVVVVWYSRHGCCGCCCGCGCGDCPWVRFSRKAIAVLRRLYMGWFRRRVSWSDIDEIVWAKCLRK